MRHRLWHQLVNAAHPSGGKFIAEGATVPTDATVGYRKGCFFIKTDGSAGTTFYVNEGSNSSCAFVGSTVDSVPVIGDTGGVSANDIVYVSGYDSTTGYRKVDKADADQITTMEDLYFCPLAIEAGAEGRAYKRGVITNIDTRSASAVKYPIYLSTTDGGWTLTEPSGVDRAVSVGTVLVKGDAADNGVVNIDLGGAERIMIHDHADNAGGGVLSIPALQGTTHTSFTVNSGAATPRLILTEGVSTGDFNYTMTVPTIGGHTGNTLPTGDGEYFALTANSDGSITANASTGTTGDTFTLASGESDGTFVLSVGATGSDNSVTLIAPVTTQDVVLTLPDAASDTLVSLGATQTLTAKTLTAPVINAATLTGILTITTPTVSGTWANLGNVTTVNIDGGTADAVVIGGDTPAAITGTTITGTTITDGTISINTGAVTGALDISGATVTYDWDGDAFTGAIVKDTDLVMIDDNGTKKEATYQVLMNGVNDLGSFTGAVVPGTDTVLIDDGGVAKSSTVQVFMNGMENLTAAGAGAVVADKLVYLDGGVAENITVQNLFNVSDLTATAGPIAPAADKLILQDNGVAELCTYQEFMDGVNDLTALAATPALTDSVLLDDGGIAKKLTVQYLLDSLHALGTDTPVSGDKIAFSDEGTASDPTDSCTVDTLATLFAGTGLTATSAAIAVTKPEKITFMVPKEFLLAGDSKTGGLAGLDQALDITATEATNTYCKSYNHDNTKFCNLDVTNIQGEWTAAYQLFPDVEVVEDACYFAADVPFCELWFDINTTATYNGAAASQIWEYSKGSSSWGTLNLRSDSTDVGGAGTGQQPFGSDGCVTFVPPADWAVETVDSLADKYWIRCRCIATVDITQTPTLNSKEHYVVTPADGCVIPFKCNISAVRVTDGNATAHTTADVKMVLMNFTKGTYSLELTFPQDKRTDRWTGTALKAASAGVDCDADDVIGFLCTQADGGAEVQNAVFELDVTPLA